MNSFYTWTVYFGILQKWIWHFCVQEPLYWPVTRETMDAGAFWREVVQVATDLEMLDFYGCLDAMR